MPFVEVALPVPRRQTFTYLYHPERHAALKVGSRVLVPFGRRRMVGYALALPASVAPSSYQLREIAEVLDDEPVFSKAFLLLLKEAAEDTLTPIGEALSVAVPAALHKPKRFLEAGGADGLSSGGRPTCSVEGRQQRTPPRQDPLLSRHPFPQTHSHILNPHQQKAFDTIVSLVDANTPATFLLHGVTGSGKTEVYLRSIAELLARGRSVLLLTPEIGLTPQMVKRVRDRFGSEVGLYHSRLSNGERLKTWLAVRNGACRLVVGTRSAIFLPFQNLGLIIIDEEQDGSYKQNDHFRYHTQDIARKRIEAEGGVLVLGSATPSLESYAKARRLISDKNQNEHYFFLPERATGSALPAVTICDMREDKRALIFSKVLLKAIEDNLNRKQQTLLFLNRRGFATFIVCNDCGEYFFCPNCHIALTLHSQKKELHCHYCDFRQPSHTQCPKCKGTRIKDLGIGTERVEEEIRKLFPAARVARLDKDTMGLKESWPKILKILDKGDLDIVIGTQMIAKGHDYPGITLVGILNADAGLNFPDFRSAERTFQLLLQVAGRAGRGQDPGRVIIQTLHPQHRVFDDLHRHEIVAFYEEELKEREALGYPPYQALARLEISGLNQERASKAATLLGAILERKKSADFTVLGPAPCPIQRIQNRFRYHMLLKVKNAALLHNHLKELLDGDVAARLASGLRFTVDLNPLNLL